MTKRIKEILINPSNISGLKIPLSIKVFNSNHGEEDKEELIGLLFLSF